MLPDDVVRRYAAIEHIFGPVALKQALRAEMEEGRKGLLGCGGGEGGNESAKL